jgi:hypothetical protein
VGHHYRIQLTVTPQAGHVFGRMTISMPHNVISDWPKPQLASARDVAAATNFDVTWTPTKANVGGANYLVCAYNTPGLTTKILVKVIVQP